MSSFSVTRAANGQIVLSMQNTNNYSVKDVGTTTGDINFSLNHTSDGSDETVLQIGQQDEAGSLKFEAADTKNSFEFLGQNIEAKFDKKNDMPYNVKWNASDSTFDSSKSKSSVIFEGGEKSKNNKFNFGTSSTKLLNKYDNVIFDGGENNIYTTGDATTTRVETTKNSKGAVVDAGNGANDFFVGGSYGVFSGGSGNDTFLTDKTNAKQNMMLGNAGSDTIYDYGQNSLFVGGSGVDVANIFGKYGIANLGFNEEGKFNFGNGSYESAVFTGEQQTDSTGKVYNYKDIMKLRGWDLETFLEKSNIKNNPYYDLIKKELEETLG